MKNYYVTLYVLWTQQFSIKQHTRELYSGIVLLADPSKLPPDPWLLYSIVLALILATQFSISPWLLLWPKLPSHLPAHQDLIPGYSPLLSSPSSPFPVLSIEYHSWGIFSPYSSKSTSLHLQISIFTSKAYSLLPTSSPTFLSFPHPHVPDS